MKEDKKYYDRLNEKDDESFGYYFKTFLIYMAIGCAIMVAASFFTSCERADDNEKETHVQEFKSDSPPLGFIGKWVSVSDIEKPIVYLTEKELHINTAEYGIHIDLTDPTIYKAYADGVYIIKHNGITIILSSGTGDYSQFLTLTINNLCISRMQRFEEKVIENNQNR